MYCTASKNRTSGAYCLWFDATVAKDMRSLKLRVALLQWTFLASIGLK
jgi:hypothetical protein